MLQDIPVCYRTHQYITVYCRTGLTSVLQDLPVYCRTGLTSVLQDLPVYYRTGLTSMLQDLPVCCRTYQYVAGWANTLLDSGVEEHVPDVASDTVAENGSHDNW